LPRTTLRVSPRNRRPGFDEQRNVGGAKTGPSNPEDPLLYVFFILIS
jgi:hypothetical protein